MSDMQPIVTNGDRVHYLHRPHDDCKGLVQRSIKLDETELGLVRWLPAADRRSSACITIATGNAHMHLGGITAAELRTIAAAMLRCAAELDTAEPQAADAAAPAHPAAHSYTISGLEATPWSTPWRRPEVA